MARPSENDRVKAWQKRLIPANKAHEEWIDEFSCDVLEQFYYGHQWSDQGAQIEQRKYVINMFFPAIEITSASTLFDRPKYEVEPRLTRMDDKLSDVEARAKLQEQTLNHYVTSSKFGFKIETGLSLLDSQFRFGIAQVGYTADFIDNPMADKPLLSDKQEPLMDAEGEPVMGPKFTMRSEGLFLKWIPAHAFRVNSDAGNRLSECDWCGYYEWHRIDDVQANKRYKNTASLKASGKLRNQPVDEMPSDEEKQKTGMVKLWFIWDNRGKKRYVFAQGHDKFFLEESFQFLPFPQPLMFNPRLGKFYPLPPSYNWMHPQRELNETREMQRIHRRRAIRRYRRSPSVEETEFDKLKTDEDMVCIVTQDESSVTPIADAALDPAVARNIAQTQDDFTRVSGISGESQEVAQSETATQANLIALASRVRDSAKRVEVRDFLADLGRVILLTLRENMALPFWIKIHVDPYSPLGMLEAQEVEKLWKQIIAEDLGDIDNDITVDMSSLSPVAQQQERGDWLTFLNLMMTPTLGAVLSQSPYLLRKTAGLFGVHSERALAEIAKSMQLMAAMAALMQATGGAGKSKGGGAAPGPTPSNGAIQGQLSQQLPVEVSQQ